MFSNSFVSVSWCTDPLVLEDLHHKALCIIADFVQLHKVPTQPLQKYLYKMADYDSIREDLNKIDWNHNLNTGSLEDAITYFYEILYKLRTTHIPSKIITGNSRYPSWYKSPLIKHLRRNINSILSLQNTEILPTIIHLLS